MDPQIEERLQTLERNVEFEKKLESLRTELAAIRRRGAVRELLGAVVVALITAVLAYWGNHERVLLDGRIATTNSELQAVQQRHETELTQLRTQHESELASRHDAIENRRTDVEIFKQLTPALMSSKPDETGRAVAIVGALDTDFWRPIASAFKKDPRQQTLVQEITRNRRERYQGLSVSCDRASHRTTDQLAPSEKSEALAFCRKVTIVSHQGADEPYKWPEGNGLSFNTGHRVGKESVWCSCAFRS